MWDPFTDKDISKLEMVQRRAVRFIFDKFKRHDSQSFLMQANDIPTLQKQRKIARLNFLRPLRTNKNQVEVATNLIHRLHGSQEITTLI